MILPYHIQFETRHINYREYLDALVEIRTKYPTIREGKARAMIFEEGIKKVLKKKKRS